MRRGFALSVASVLLVGIAACSEPAAPPAATEAVPQVQFRPTATIQDLMDAEIDPAADYLWGAVAYIATGAGIEDRRPKTDADWEKARLNAIILIEASNLLLIEGRKVAKAGNALDEEELASEAPEDIQKAIDANRPAFNAYAMGLHDASMEALAAIEAKDIERLLASGETLDVACEQCHRTYWYPKAPPI